jgi:hypothetical protein
MDARFCSACNRLAPGRPPVSLADVLACLNAEKVRATQSAVAGAVGLTARATGSYVHDPRTEASWIVDADTGLPAGFGPDQIHPDLLSSPHVITTPTELLLRVASWKARFRT